MSREQSEMVIEKPWFSVEKEIVVDDPGWEGKSFYQVNEPNGAMVCAFTRDEKLILVRQFRPAVEHYVLDLPAGCIDDGESPKDAARRELLEETGYVCEELFYVGAGWGAVNRINSTLFLFFGKGAVRDIKYESENWVQVETISIPELKKLIASNQFRLFGSLGALLFIKLKLMPRELEML